MNDFINFAAAHGLLIDGLQEGRWIRVKTEDKPTKRNGAYKYLRDVGFVQNHATMQEVAVWHSDRKPEYVDRKEYVRRTAEKRAAERRSEDQRRDRARAEARALIAACQSATHAYLVSKGFPKAQGLVHPGGDLIIPMRDITDYSTVNSVQRIGADGSKLFLPGGKAKGSVFIIGKGAWRERWLVEGYATGLSVAAALADLRRQAEVIVCFSAGNLKHVAGLVKRPAFVMADNDASRAGQEAAESTKAPWVMPHDVGCDANDLHTRYGLRRLVELIAGVR